MVDSFYDDALIGLEQEIAHVDLRTLMFTYMCLNPGTTQTDVAKKIGTSPMALSRAINGNKQFIKEEWLPSVIELLLSLDLSDFNYHLNTIVQLQTAYLSIQSEKSSCKAIIDYIKTTSSVNYEFDITPLLNTDSHLAFRLMNTTTQSCWVFLNLDNPTEPYYSDPFNVLNRIVSSDRISVFTQSIYKYDSYVKQQMLKKRSKREAIDGRYRSIFYINPETKRVESEFVISKKHKIIIKTTESK